MHLVTSDEIIIAVMHCRFGMETINNHVRSKVPVMVSMDIAVFRVFDVCRHIPEKRNLQFMVHMFRKAVSYSTDEGLCVNMFTGFIRVY
jgi:hypothetical protein